MTFFTVTIYDYDYIDAQHHVSTSKIDVEVHLFPVAPETFINILLHDFKSRIKQSQNTPSWLQTMRQNLIRTVLNGEYLRLDDVKTQVILRTRGTRGKDVLVPNKRSGELDRLVVDEKHQLKGSEVTFTTGEDGDESVATLNASEWHMKGAQQRLYHFGSINAQLRRSWDPKCDKATFAFVAQDSSWVLAPHPYVVSTTEKPAQHKPLWLIYLLCFFNKPLFFVLKAFFSFPLTLIKTIHDPASALTIHSSRIDVTFDQFRLRDAELVSQSWEYVRRQYELLKEKKGMDIKGFVQDMLMMGVLGHRGKSDKCQSSMG
ncbi:hypothetical protein C0995_002048 [Termitomyces sp. Mi166|nr:hypothetical protein C0995_002048 [Termitomyces sp. Mi166\